MGLVGNVQYYTSGGRRLASEDVNVSAEYARAATKEEDLDVYSYWTCKNGGRYIIVTHRGVVVYDGTGEWPAPWEM